MTAWTVTGPSLIGYGDRLPSLPQFVPDLHILVFSLRENLSAVHPSPSSTQHDGVTLLHDAASPGHGGCILLSVLAAVRRSGLVRVPRRPYGPEELR